MLVANPLKRNKEQFADTSQLVPEEHLCYRLQRMIAICGQNWCRLLKDTSRIVRKFGNISCAVHFEQLNVRFQ